MPDGVAASADGAAFHDVRPSEVVAASDATGEEDLQGGDAVGRGDVAGDGSGRARDSRLPHEDGGPEGSGVDGVAGSSDVIGSGQGDGKSTDTNGACGALPALFGSSVREHVAVCKSCHDMTVDPGFLKAPGPQWWHPTDDGAIVDYLLGSELVDSTHPAMSRFLLKPLAIADGGLKHLGGDLVKAGTPAHLDFLTFLEAAAPCVPSPP